MNSNTWKKAIAVLVLAASSLMVLAADESVDIWKQMYREAASDSQRRMVMIKIMELKNQDFAPLLLTALNDLYTRRIEAGSTTERSAKIDLCRMLIRELGNLKATEAISQIYAIYNEINDPLLRYECSIALGRLRANDFAFKLVRDLSDLNLAPDDKNPRPKEIRAFGLVQGLDAMHWPQSYEALFLAANGWYSNASQVKDVARVALSKFTDDPSDDLISIIAKNPSVKIKLSALGAADSSKAPADKKAGVARAALRIGLDFAPNTPADTSDLSLLRKKALTMLVNTGDHDPTSVPLLHEIVSRDRNDNQTYDETLQSIAAAGYNASDAAAAFLTDRLEYFNDRQRKEINTARDKIMVREIVAAIKRAKNPLTKTVLFKTMNLDLYDAIILKEAKDAMTVFGN